MLQGCIDAPFLRQIRELTRKQPLEVKASNFHVHEYQLVAITHSRSLGWMFLGDQSTVGLGVDSSFQKDLRNISLPPAQAFWMRLELIWVCETECVFIKDSVCVEGNTVLKLDCWGFLAFHSLSLYSIAELEWKNSLRSERASKLGHGVKCLSQGGGSELACKTF